MLFGCKGDWDRYIMGNGDGIKIFVTLWEQSARDNNNSNNRYSCSNSNDNKNKNLIVKRNKRRAKDNNVQSARYNNIRSRRIFNHNIKRDKSCRDSFGLG